jgi:hypothetical protein
VGADRREQLVARALAEQAELAKVGRGAEPDQSSTR